MSYEKNRPIVVVTGANGIIGSSFCKCALLKGWNVIALDLKSDLLDSLLEENRKYLMIERCDIREKNSVERVLKDVLRKWGKVDGLFNNASWKGENIRDFFLSFEEYSLNTWREIMSVNLDAMMIVSQIIGGYMANQQGYGSIVNTASIYGIMAPDQRIYEGSNYLGGSINSPAVYSASKGAVIALTRYLATYWSSKGVRVNSISPGGVFSGQNDTFVEYYSDRVPMKRMAKDEEIVEGALFLLSPLASYINGHNLVIDGGMTIW